MEACVLAIVVLIGAALSICIIMWTAESRAREAYLESLEELKRNPISPEKRERALELGRRYVQAANAARNGTTPGAFSELMLMNDINAACARASFFTTPLPPSLPPQAIPVNQPQQQQPPIEDRLNRLDDLRAKSLVSEDEYQERRRRILDDL